MRSIFSIAIILLSVTAIQAQTPPVPSQFATARTAFLASGGNTMNADENYTAMVYTSTYQMLQSINHYQLVSTPADAELSFEVSVLPNASTTWFLRLAVYDTKTHTLLWNIDSIVNGDVRAKDEQKFLDAAEGRIAGQLKALILGALPQPTVPNKSH